MRGQTRRRSSSRRAIRPGAPRSHRRQHHHRSSHAENCLNIRDDAVAHAMSDARSVRPSSERSLGPVAIIAALLGVTVALGMTGLGDAFESMNTLPHAAGLSVYVMIAGVALLSLSVGIRAPQHFALFVCLMIWRRLKRQGRALDVSSVMVLSPVSDRPLHWMVLSVIALASGAAAGLLPLTVRFGAAFHVWMRRHFLWSHGSEAVLQAATITLASVCFWMLLGLAISCIHRLSCGFGRWETKATGWSLIGAAVGLSLSSIAATFGVRHGMILMATALPVLIVSMIAALTGSGHSAEARSDEETTGLSDEEFPLRPIASDRWPLLLRGSIVAVSAAGAGVVGCWEQGAGLPATRAAMPIILLAMGVGVLLGCWPKRRGIKSIGGFGVACGVAGIATALAVLLCATTPSLPSAVRHAVGALGIATIGFAMAYGRHVLLGQVANRSFAGAGIMARALVASTLMVWVAVPVAGRTIGWSVAMLAIGLGLLALGGTLVIFEPTYSRRTRRLRLTSMFIAVGLLISLIIWQPDLLATHLRHVEEHRTASITCRRSVAPASSRCSVSADPLSLTRAQRVGARGRRANTKLLALFDRMLVVRHS